MATSKDTLGCALGCALGWLVLLAFHHDARVRDLHSCKKRIAPHRHYRNNGRPNSPSGGGHRQKTKIPISQTAKRRFA